MKTQQADFTAWRYTFFLPGCMHMIVGILVLIFAQDLPDGRYLKLRRSGTMVRASYGGFLAHLQAVYNYRMWMLMLGYGMCFGIELTMNNVIVVYLFDHFDLPLTTAGMLGSVFGEFRAGCCTCVRVFTGSCSV